MGPQGKDPMCPCAMRRAGLPSSLKPWTEDDIKALKCVLGEIKERKRK